MILCKDIKKIAAFTLTEMLIVLAISAIVAGLAFTIISLFTRNLYQIQNNYTATTKKQLFQEQLSIDFNRFHQISYTPELEKMNLMSPLDSISYLFSENLIIRNTDTLYFSEYSKSIFLLGKEISQGKVDAIKILFPSNNSSLFIYKPSDAFSQIENDGN